jgi:hypothetical protein
VDLLRSSDNSAGMDCGNRDRMTFKLFKCHRAQNFLRQANCPPTSLLCGLRKIRIFVRPKIPAKGVLGKTPSICSVQRSALTHDRIQTTRKVFLGGKAECSRQPPNLLRNRSAVKIRGGRYCHQLFFVVGLDRPAPKTFIESDFFSLESGIDKTFQKRDIFIFFDRSRFFAYKFRVDLFTREPISRRRLQGLCSTRSMFRRYSIHA